MEQSATAVDTSDVRREQLDGEDIEYQCDECSRVFSTYGGLTAHQHISMAGLDTSIRREHFVSCVLW